MKLNFGYGHADFRVRKAHHHVAGLPQITICYLADLHLNGYSSLLVEQLIESIYNDKPDLILLGGDYVDTNKGWPFFERLLEACHACCATFAIAGNHDRFFGLARIRAAVETSGVHWLEQGVSQLNLKNCRVDLYGEIPERRSNEASLSIAVLHEPVDSKALENKCELAFAGHLHGCQFVLMNRNHGLYPGKWFYRNNFTEFRKGSFAYFISRGLGDTLPIRLNCPHEYLRVTCGE